MAANAELSSIATGLKDLTRRITQIADGLGGDERDRLGPDLYEVERLLSAGQRRLTRIVDGR
jgi:hypothetical protein